MRDWITSPGSWGEWGMKANAWFNELRDTVTDLVAAVAVNTASIADLPGTGAGGSYEDTAGIALATGTVVVVLSGASCPEAGLYVVGARLQSASSFGPDPLLRLTRGSDGEIFDDGTQGIGGFPSGAWVVRFGASDSFSIAAFQSTGGTVTLNNREFEWRKVSD